MITFMDSKEKLKEVDKCLDGQLWHACAGGMVQMPPVNTKVFYFPQGHAEHACGPVDFRSCPKIPPQILCTLAAIKYLADPETDEVYAKISLLPLNAANHPDYDNDRIPPTQTHPKPASFAKTLTQSDANNGGGFSVPRYCAETIFPRLDYSADPPVQTILAKDVHGETWKFRHIYRGTPRRHLLTTGWSTFVNHKKLVAGDSIVFLRAENGDLCVGIRRAKRGIGGGPDSSSGWNPAGGNCHVPYGGFSAFLREDDSKLLRNGNSNGLMSSSGNLMGRGKVRPEAVVEAATLAAKGQPFEVVYYPRASTPEFCVKASLLKAALQIRWCSGMRFKMAFETEDSSRISWFMGTISSVQVADPLRWPDSPWRLLQVTWDEPDLLQNVKRVSPWLVELVSNMPAIHPSSFPPPLKKMRLAQHPDFPFDAQIPMPTFPTNLLGPTNPFPCVPETSPAGMQGARHAHYGLSLSDLHLNKLQSGLFPAGLDHTASASPLRISNNPTVKNPSSMSDNVSCLLSIATSTHSSKKQDDMKAPPQLVLFGQTILSEQQISLSASGDTENSSSNGNADKLTKFSDASGSARQDIGANLETGHCKVFMESEDVGRTMDLSLLGSYDELYRKLEDMFGIDKSEMVSHVIYRDITTGAVKHIGDEPFSDFTKTARRLTILMDSSSDNLRV
ncbi:auxin response factor 18-like [Senna tora]|uniref:Auxin response factor n=1 Tax=Senna tora TaxID=362788 RepID=A0A834TAJ1_9FABA|nr:auxin response factor 18-like [Senna tora]